MNLHGWTEAKSPSAPGFVIKQSRMRNLFKIRTSAYFSVLPILLNRIKNFLKGTRCVLVIGWKLMRCYNTHSIYRNYDIYSTERIKNLKRVCAAIWEDRWEESAQIWPGIGDRNLGIMENPLIKTNTLSNPKNYTLSDAHPHIHIYILLTKCTIRS